MAKYHKPGVYFEWEDRRFAGVSLARADVTGFAGIAMRGPVQQPVRVESWNQFTSVFGRPSPSGHLAWAVQGFFANGGRRCWVIRVASNTARCAQWRFPATGGGPGITLAAATPGSWAKDLSLSLLSPGPGLFTLTLRLPDGLRETWRNLDIQKPFVDLPGSDGSTVLRVTVGQAAVWSSPPMLTVTATSWQTLELRSGGNVATVASNGAEGATPTWASGMPAYFAVQRRTEAAEAVSSLAPVSEHPGVRRFTVSPRFAGNVLNDAVSGSHLVRVLESDAVPAVGAIPDYVAGTDGLADLTIAAFHHALEQFAQIDEIAILTLPDLLAKPQARFTAVPREVRCSLDVPARASTAPPSPPEMPPAFSPEEIARLQQEMVAQCALLKDRVAVLDYPHAQGSLEDLQAWRHRFNSSYAACYYPWLMVPDQLTTEGELRSIPPSGHMAGIYSRVEHMAGVHKPPANEILEGVEDVTASLDSTMQGLLNDEQLNVIVPMRARRVRVAGARTGSDARAWLFINVRRLFIAVERSVRMQLDWVVFEPNGPALWRQVDRVMRSFLEGLWKRGMLDGSSRDAAYSVTCDATVNPDRESSRGKVICEIGLLPPWPAEFVILRIGITEGSVEMLSPAEAAGA